MGRVDRVDRVDRGSLAGRVDQEENHEEKKLVPVLGHGDMVVPKIKTSMFDIFRRAFRIKNIRI